MSVLCTLNILMEAAVRTDADSVADLPYCATAKKGACVLTQGISWDTSKAFSFICRRQQVAVYEDLYLFHDGTFLLSCVLTKCSL